MIDEYCLLCKINYFKIRKKNQRNRYLLIKTKTIEYKS